jgi:hypothetical protein
VTQAAAVADGSPSATTGGPPTGTFRENAAGGYEQRFAVQCLSRFGIAAQLAAAGVVKAGIILVAAPGSGGNKAVDVEDLDFAKARQTGEWKSGVFGLLAQGARQSSVLDSVSQVSRRFATFAPETSTHAHHVLSTRRRWQSATRRFASHTSFRDSARRMHWRMPADLKWCNGLQTRLAASS